MMVTGEDVIGKPGQNLTAIELELLVSLADGDTPTTTQSKLNIDQHSVRHIESTIKRKLGAKTKLHMITRGFVLSVLMPRALCLVLAALSAGTLDSSMLRLRQNSRTRTSFSLARVGRSSFAASA